MKGFQKLALVSAIAALPMTGFAMEALDDATLSGVTGQDGILLTLGLDQTMNIIIDDTDGLTGTGYSGVGNPLEDFIESGGIHIFGAGIDGGAGVATDVAISIDAGSDGTDGVLLVNVNLAAGTRIVTGDIAVRDTSLLTTNLQYFTAADVAPTDVILDSTTITFASAVDLDIQLGAGAENFLRFTNANIGTLTLSAFALNDVGAVGDGAIRAASIEIGGLNLSGTTASILNNGLEVTLGGSLTAVTMAITDLKLGNAASASIGDVYISGLNMAGNTLTISGK